jgi:hypothetical protein
VALGLENDYGQWVLASMLPPSRPFGVQLGSSQLLIFAMMRQYLSGAFEPTALSELAWKVGGMKIHQFANWLGKLVFDLVLS